MRTRIALLLLTVLLAFAAVGCATRGETGTPAVSDPGTTTPEPGAAGGSAGMRLANGLYDLEDGTVQAIGTLTYVNLEGGFWAVTGAPAAEGGEDAVIAVIANGAELQDALEPLAGKTVTVLGTRLEGASTRMAGPEIEATSVEEINDTIDPAS